MRGWRPFGGRTSLFGGCPGRRLMARRLALRAVFVAGAGGAIALRCEAAQPKRLSSGPQYQAPSPVFDSPGLARVPLAYPCCPSLASVLALALAAPGF